MRKIRTILAALVVATGLVMVAPTPAQAYADWASCGLGTYNRICLFTENGGGGLKYTIWTSGDGPCVNLTSPFHDTIDSVDNAWNDADIKIYLHRDVNCSPVGPFKTVHGNQATNITPNIASSFRVECTDFFNNCYTGP
jgi:hypothetical protein